MNATNTTSTPRWTVFAFALGVLVIGFLPASLLFVLNPNTASTIGLDAVPLPAWAFIVVWLIIYPSMGIATWFIWKRRLEIDVRLPLLIFAAVFLQNLSFWFTNSLRMTATMDATEMLWAFTLAWVYYRYSKPASRWLLPLMVWMPITFVIKLWTIFLPY
jgi:translocator protein